MLSKAARLASNRVLNCSVQQQRLNKTNDCVLPFSALLAGRFDIRTRTMATLTLDNMNPCIKAIEYAVRGPIVIRAAEIEKELEKGESKPFQAVIRANIGDCHAMGQKPITFIRQILALCSQPELLNDPRYPDDVKEKAKRILQGARGYSVGSYSDSAGIEVIRKDVSAYIEARDGGVPSDYNNIILCSGASDGIRGVLKLFNKVENGKPAGIMIPIPQYPLYTASLAEFALAPINYYLDEDNNWGLDIKELKRSVDEARKVCNPRAIVIINPGNPTGQVLTEKNIIEVIKFAAQEKLFILADEVYQHNVYAAGSKFHSFKKVLNSMGSPYTSLELASFMSSSKGYMGECGLRGGYAELCNMDEGVRAMLLKSISAKLCPTVLGQAVMDSVVNTPKKGEPSFEKFEQEKKAVLASLKDRAEMVAQTFNSIPGFKCNAVQGAMYAFPRMDLPKKAIAKAKADGVEPDMFYAMQLLENTGICIVPGSGFGQRPGTFHFRTTILPPKEKIAIMLDKLKAFHLKFLEQYK